MIKWTSDLLFQLRIFLSQVVIISGHLPKDKSVSFEIDTSYFVITQVYNDPINLRKSISCLADARPSLSMTADSCDEWTSTTHTDKLMPGSIASFYLKPLPPFSFNPHVCLHFFHLSKVGFYHFMTPVIPFLLPPLLSLTKLYLLISSEMRQT